MTIDLDSDSNIDLDDNYIDTTLLKEIRCDFDNYITQIYPSLEKIRLGKNVSNNTYVDNSVFVSSSNYYSGIMPGGYVRTCRRSNSNSDPDSNSKNDIITIIFTIIVTTLMLIAGINIFFKDPYIQFSLSGINKKIKRIHNESIFKSYKNWKKKFVNRTFTRLLIKIGIFISVLVTILMMIYNIENVIPYLVMSCLGVIIWFILSWTDYFNDKEVGLYLELLSAMDVFVGKKSQ